MASISFRFPENTKPVGVTVELGMQEAWEILREQHRIFYRDDAHCEHKGQPGLTRSLMDKLRETMQSYPDPSL